MNKSKQKPPRWKREQGKRKKQERDLKVKLGLSFIGLIGLLVFSSFLYKGAKDSLWDGRSSIGVVEQTKEDIRLEVFLPSQLRIVEFVIPNNTMVKVPFGFGDYELKNVYQLGKLDNKGGKVLKRTVQNVMGIGVLGFKVSSQTNLTWWDRGRLVWFKQFKVKKKSLVELANQPAWQKERLKDGREVFRSSQRLVDEVVNKMIFDEEIVDEALSLAVLNASGVKGVASDVSRLAANMGVQVRLVNNLENAPESKVLVRDKKIKEGVTVKRLVRVLGINKIEIGEVDEYRSDIVMVMGEDYTSL